MGEIYDEISTCKENHGQDVSNPSTKRLVKRIIPFLCEDKCEIVMDTSNKNTSYVVPKNLTRQMLIEENVKLKKQIKATNKEIDHNKCAQQIRSDGKKLCIGQQWPSNPNDAMYNDFLFPNSLENFLSTILDGHISND